ncbi:lipoyl(octanoyl) transferase LipB [Endozoicomonas sp. GU-1]|uniref:lipoyl(octanoyl) transferase LipB n=1 Tax=Endozoicomonas sp. GU-1 TaxID=3009078 RepID=UPI0022B39392|nr:lipoyl(octanoyl) transferase LipB [Endozoicomonas sp. GU-1]WBA82766.1 lipoyl(octanoyl) transferase LipB [Endozoicomonas sp. GU-1]WBA85696.1 lipoyl(octanoyl) transferase LipB [Endozoicomonas sp. GU-1]
MAESTRQSDGIENDLIVRYLGRRNYEPVWQAMKAFTANRDDQTRDEFWVVEHPPVFTQGQAGKPEHVLFPGDIPVIQVDRGGQVTYHGPGQLVFYFLMDVRRKKSGPRAVVSALESAVIAMLASYGLEAQNRPDAPGVYVNGAKIASLGLRFRKMCSYHGLSLNVDMDLEPFNRINPCGYRGLNVVDMASLLGNVDREEVSRRLLVCFQKALSYINIDERTAIDELLTADSGDKG